MVKNELLGLIVEGKITETKKEAEVLLSKINELIDTFEEVSEAGEKIKVGRLTIEKVHKEARIARNPKTGAEVQVEAKDVLKAKIK